jgi:ferredoxin
VACCGPPELFQEALAAAGSAAGPVVLNLRDQAFRPHGALAGVETKVARLLRAAMRGAEHGRPAPERSLRIGPTVLIATDSPAGFHLARRLEGVARPVLVLDDRSAAFDAERIHPLPWKADWGRVARVDGSLGAFRVAVERTQPLSLDACIRCRRCIPVCHTSAISEGLRLRTELCDRCGDCLDACGRIGAIRIPREERETVRADQVVVVGGGPARPPRRGGRATTWRWPRTGRRSTRWRGTSSASSASSGRSSTSPTTRPPARVEPRLNEGVLREITMGALSIGYNGATPERLKRQQEWAHVFEIKTKKAVGGPVHGEQWGLPWPCWSETHPGTPILSRIDVPVSEGGCGFRAVWGPKAPDGRELLAAAGSAPVGGPDAGYAAEANYATDLTQGAIQKALSEGRSPYGNGRARFNSWNIPDPLPVHREPIHSPRPDLIAKWPTYDDVKEHYRVPQPYKSMQKPDWVEAYPLILTTGRVVEYEGGAAQERSSPWLVELNPEMYVEVHPKVAHDHGPRHGDWCWIESPEDMDAQPSRIKVKVKVTKRVGPDTVFLPFHWGGVFGVQVGILDAPERLEDGSHRDVAHARTPRSAASPAPGLRPSPDRRELASSAPGPRVSCGQRPALDAPPVRRPGSPPGPGSRLPDAPRAPQPPRGEPGNALS